MAMNEPSMMHPEGLASAVENLKDITEGTAKTLPDHSKSTPRSYYKYNSIASKAGKVLVILGTLIWAFGDYAVKLVSA